MKVIEVAAAVIRRDGQVLICSRPPDKPPAGWEFPGGKLEPGETPAAALRRELAEELGVEVAVLDPVYELTHEYPDRTVRLFFLRAVLAAEQAPAAREGQAWRWVPESELLVCDLLPADRPVAEFLNF